MKSFAIAALVILSGAAGLKAQTGQPPVKEHEWLQQFVGEWESEQKGFVTESIRSLGGFFVVSESKVMVGDKPMTAIQTLGYSPTKKKYVGTFVCSMDGYLWVYDGTVDPSGKVLTMVAEGPNPLSPGKLFKYRDVHEFKSKDHRVVTSACQVADGKWQTFQTVSYRRKK